MPRTKISRSLRRGRGADRVPQKMSAVQNHKLFPTPKQKSLIVAALEVIGKVTLIPFFLWKKYSPVET